MRKSVFVILAAGGASRFDGEGAKQLHCVEGERLLDRAVRQFGAYGEVWVVTLNDELVVEGAKKLEPQRCACTCESALSSQGVWADDTTILLGDVYYSDEAVQRIVNRTRKLVWFTDGHDIFAIGFSKSAQDRLVKEMEFVGGNVEEMWKGRLWHAYHHMYGYKKRPKVRCWTRGVNYIGDKTQDFDTESDFTEFEAGDYKNMLHPQTRNKQKWPKRMCQALALWRSRVLG